MLYILQYTFKCLLKDDFAKYLKVCDIAVLNWWCMSVSKFRNENCRGQQDCGRVQVHGAAVWLNSDGETLKNGNVLIFSLPHLEFFSEYNF